MPQKKPLPPAPPPSAADIASAGRQVPETRSILMWLLAGTTAVIIVVAAAFLWITHSLQTAAPADPSEATLPEPSLSATPTPTVTDTTTHLEKVSGPSYLTNSTLAFPAPSTPAASSAPAHAYTPSPETLNLTGVTGMAIPTPGSSATPVSPADLGYAAPPAGTKAADFAGVRAFFNTLKTDDAPRIVKECWNQTPEVLMDRYFTPQARAEILKAMSTPAEITPAALTWKTLRIRVEFPWAELDSKFSCPSVVVGGKPDVPTPADARHVIVRLLQRWAKSPLNEKDVEADYPLLCREWDPPAELIGANNPAAKEMLSNQSMVPDSTVEIVQSLRREDVYIYSSTPQEPTYFKASTNAYDGVGPGVYFGWTPEEGICLGSVSDK